MSKEIMSNDNMMNIDENNINITVNGINETSNDGSEKRSLFNILKSTSTNKIPLTVIYCMVFWNFGICVALFGPTLLDLACQTGTSLTAISWLYFIQNFTSLIGCIASGLLIKHAR